MSTIKVTGGAVTYERNVKVADYETKKLSFTINYGSDDEWSSLTDEQLGGLADRAINLVHEKLGITAPRKAPATSPAQQPATNPAATTAPTGTNGAAPAAPPKRGPRKPPVVEVKDITPDEIEAAKIKAGNISESPEDRKDPAAIEDEAPSGAGDATATETVDETAASVVEGDPAATDLDDILSAAPPDITDSALIDAITKKNAAIKNPIAIRQVIGEFVKPPKQAKDIPQDQRQAFLDKLKAL